MAQVSRLLDTHYPSWCVPSLSFLAFLFPEFIDVWVSYTGLRVVRARHQRHTVWVQDDDACGSFHPLPGHAHQPMVVTGIHLD